MSTQPPLPGEATSESSEPKVPDKACAFRRDFGIGMVVSGALFLGFPIARLFRPTDTSPALFLVLMIPFFIVAGIGVIMIVMRKRAFEKLPSEQKAAASKGGAGGFIGGFFTGLVVATPLSFVTFIVADFVASVVSGSAY